MTEIAPTIQCPCGSRFREELFVYRSPPAGETAFALGTDPYQRAYDRCRVCGHAFGRHRLDLSEIYASDYVDATYGGSDGMRRRYERILALPPEQSDNVARVRRVEEFAQGRCSGRPRPWRVLDVGAGLGVFPAAMKRVGWHAVAVEPDERTVRHLAEVVGIPAWHGQLSEARRNHADCFDAVTLNKVLEHVEDPVGLLVDAAAFLRPEGFLYVEVPDIAAAEGGAEREEFFIEHHHVFSPGSLAAVIERAGCDVIRVDRLREPSGKYSLIAFAYARAGVGTGSRHG